MPDSIAERAAVVAEAITWLNTPYIARARVKRAGVDCAQLLIAAYANAGMIDNIDPGKYAVQWGQNQTEEKYLNSMIGLTTEIADIYSLPADIVVFRMGRTYCHGAIVVEWPHKLIHASEFSGVQYGGMNEGFWADRLHKLFRLNRWL